MNVGKGLAVLAIGVAVVLNGMVWGLAGAVRSGRLTVMDPPCQAADVAAVWVGTNGATGGQVLGTLQFANTSWRPCSLTGSPNVRLFQVSGEELSVSIDPCQGDRDV